MSQHLYENFKKGVISPVLALQRQLLIFPAKRQSQLEPSVLHFEPKPYKERGLEALDQEGGKEGREGRRKKSNLFMPAASNAVKSTEHSTYACV
jgi:hypothetical protein